MLCGDDVLILGSQPKHIECRVSLEAMQVRRGCEQIPVQIGIGVVDERRHSLSGICPAGNRGEVSNTSRRHTSLTRCFNEFPNAFSFFLVLMSITDGGSGAREGYDVGLFKSLFYRDSFYSQVQVRVKAKGIP